MKKLGLVVNPIAGMGGKVGLKGTDGADALRQALTLGAQPNAHRRAVEALAIIAKAMQGITLVTCAGAMGEDAARECGISPALVGGAPKDKSKTTAADTRHAIAEMQRIGVDLLLFAGGDGTARDICDALQSNAVHSERLPALGIPAGVKMHSGVFALTPRRAGELALRFLDGGVSGVIDAEVMDIDEDAFRMNSVAATLYGYLSVPQDSDTVQFTKSGTTADEQEALAAIARQVIADMVNDTLYIIGPGTTTKAVTDALAVSSALLGVDAVLNGRLLAADATESDLLRLTERRRAKIVVTAIGGQGYIIGRGNQQISPRLIRRIGRDNIIVAATRSKLQQLIGRPLLVDTGDSALDEEMSGYIKVITGFREFHTYKVSC